MVGHDRLVNGAGVVVKPARNRQINSEEIVRNAEAAHVPYDGCKLVGTGVEGFVLSTVFFKRGKHRFGVAAGRDEADNAFGALFVDPEFVREDLCDLIRTDFLKLVNSAEYVARLVGQTEDLKEAVQHLAVVDPDPEAPQSEFCERAVDYRRYFSLVHDIKASVADNVDVSLIEFPESASLRPLSAVDLSYLVAAEGKRELPAVLCHVSGKRNREVKAERKVGIALCEAVYLLFGLSAALGKKHLRRLDKRRVKRREAVE